MDLENAAMTRNEMTMTRYQENVTRDMANARGGYFKDFSPFGMNLGGGRSHSVTLGPSLFDTKFLLKYIKLDLRVCCVLWTCCPLACSHSSV